MGQPGSWGSLAQRRPNFFTRRAEAVLNEIDKGQTLETKESIEADMVTKRVWRDSMLAGYSYEGRWHWTDDMIEQLRKMRVDPQGATAEIEERF